MPPGSAAVVDTMLVFFLMFVPGALVAYLHQSCGSPLGGVQIGVIGIMVTFGLVTLYAWVRRRVLSLELRTRWSLIRYGLFMLAWFPLAFWVYPMVVRAMDYPLPAQEVLKYVASWPDDGFLWPAVAVACIVAPIGEELVFRGFLFRVVELHSHRFVALLGTSLLFALAHEQSVALPIFFLGLFFGYLRMKTGGVGSSILIHMVHNSWTIGVAMAAPETVYLVFDK